MLLDGDLTTELGLEEDHTSKTPGPSRSGYYLLTRDTVPKTASATESQSEVLTEDEASSEEGAFQGQTSSSSSTLPLEGGPPFRRKRVYPKLTLPQDKAAATKFLAARLKPIKKAMQLIEETFRGGATCFFYCKPKFGDARQIVSTNICPTALNTNMKHSVFINFLDSLSQVTIPARNIPFEPNTIHWDTFQALMTDVDMACLKKTIRRIAHLIDGSVKTITVDLAPHDVAADISSLKKTLVVPALVRFFSFESVHLTSVWSACFNVPVPVTPSPTNTGLKKFFSLLRAFDLAHILKGNTFKLPRHPLEGPESIVQPHRNHSTNF